MDEKRDRVYWKWGLTALAVICISVVLVVIFTDLPGFFHPIVSVSTHEKNFQNHLVKSFHFNYNPSDT